MSAPVVLIVDDEKYIRSILRAYLEDEGFEVLIASDAEDAMLVLGQKRADIGIVDIRLPGASGDDFIRRAHMSFPDMKFIVHTGSPSYQINDALRSAGVRQKDVIQKPLIDMAVLSSAIKTKLGV